MRILEFASKNNASINVALSNHYQYGFIGKKKFILKFRKYRKARVVFLSFIEKYYDVKILKNIINLNSNLKYSVFKQDIGECSKDILHYPNRYNLLNNSLHSSFVTEMANSADSNFSTVKYRKRIFDYYLDFDFSYHQIKSITTRNEINLVIFFNGRAPIQAGVREFCEEIGLNWLSLEHGSAPGRSFRLDPYQDQERIQNQNSYKKFLNECSNSQKNELMQRGRSWLVSQENQRNQNNFIRENVETSQYMEYITKPFVNIFTSSVDENISSAGWGNEDLREFIEKTVQISYKLKLQGLQPVIVMHPNSLNKSWRDLALQLETYKKEKILTIPPWAQISSYELLSRAFLNITWRSTLGLEISGNGLPCYVFGDTFYDLVTDVKKIDFENLDQIIFKGWKVDRAKSLEYIGYLYSYGIDSNLIDSSSHHYNLIKFLENYIPLGSKTISLKNKLRIFKPLINPVNSTPANLFDLTSKIFGRKFAIKIVSFIIRHIHKKLIMK